MDFAPKVQGQKILLPIIPKSSKNLMQFGGGATFPTVYPAYITDTINSTATNQRSSPVVLCTHLPLPRRPLPNRKMKLFLFAERQFHDANHRCFKCQRDDEGNGIREKKVAAEQPRLSQPNSFVIILVNIPCPR